MKIEGQVEKQEIQNHKDMLNELMHEDHQQYIKQKMITFYNKEINSQTKDKLERLLELIDVKII